ncbi:MAG: PAS domain-containing sensor histidine kinase [Candidatus Obscuribacterales bacterium]|nr:PAS domain-containing sensor histidine kinase [Candidatus Obscuribacterales bacterium]
MVKEEPSSDYDLSLEVEPPPALEALLRAVEAARNGIVLTDPGRDDNPIVYANPSFLELTGYSLPEVIGKNCRFLQGSDNQQDEIEKLRLAIAQEKHITVLLRNYTKSGVLFWNELTVSPVHNERGQLINFIGIQNDISARLEADTRIAEFYSMISHELRTPLSSIRASLGLLDDRAEVITRHTGAENAHLVSIALRNTDRLIRLIGDIIDIRKIELGKLELNYTRFGVNQLVRDSISEVSALAGQSNVEIKVEPGGRLHLTADRDRILQVLVNLLANAIKFSEPGKTVSVRVTSLPRSTIKFEVIDNGPGIAASDARSLFVKFKQLDSSDSRRKGGSGLGLAISRSLVEMHGGAIGVNSRVGEGSTFWFTLAKQPRAR